MTAFESLIQIVINKCEEKVTTMRFNWFAGLKQVKVGNATNTYIFQKSNQILIFVGNG